MQRKVVIKNRGGIHARPAALIAKLASSFPCDIFLSKDGIAGRVNAKSVLGIMVLEGVKGEEITITAEGKRSREAVRRIVELFEKGFFEE